VDNSSSPLYDVLGLGCATVDDLLYVDAYPQPDTKTRIIRSERQCGGLTATALVAAARFGAKCAYGGQLGDNELSAFVDSALQADGIDTSIAPRRPDASPIHSTIIVDTVHHTRNIFFEIAGPTGADDELPSEDVIRGARVLFVDHYGIPGNLRAIEIARAGGIPVVADVERDNVPRFYEMLPLIDHLIVSRRFASKLTGKDDSADAAAALMTPGRKAAVVTDGEHGCWFVVADCVGEVLHQPAFPVDVVDTTGCGDVFHGVYAAALAEGRGIEECVRFANAAAALKARQYGAQGGIPNRAEVERLQAGTPVLR
jgi:sugar/nucleoside kinase (ribokinase family)